MKGTKNCTMYQEPYGAKLSKNTNQLHFKFMNSGAGRQLTKLCGVLMVPLFSRGRAIISQTLVRLKFPVQ